jgi:lipoprotein-anchoring transpeptidase ErfK/SrfK
MNATKLLRTRVTPAAMAVALVTASPPAQLYAQAAPEQASAASAATAGVGPASAAIAGEPNALERGRYAVLIDLDVNILYFKRGELTLWSAPVGTGTGMRVITDSDDWDFSTPAGRFEVQYKERNPVWIAPDWFFVENNLRVPPKNSPARHIPGTLGEAAVYISPHLAIHGTDRPELLGQRVSHGCIRLENRYARRLYHNIQVGTEVIIVGGENVRENARVVDLRRGYDPSLASTGGPRKPQDNRVTDGWKRLTTLDLLDVLDTQIAAAADVSRWDEVAILLLERGKSHDDRALQGLFARAATLPTAAMEREWATLLVDAYRGAAPRVLATIGQLDEQQAMEAATLIVSASMALFNGDFEDTAAPWPTLRAPRELLQSPAAHGWDVLAGAERALRDAERVQRGG